ncbi:hypothetical protein [Archangium sp.]|uniref:hypothetical protein n=1 Tax=Archangium sp. TaxID=1872627 RepID=UPI00389A3C06
MSIFTKGGKRVVQHRGSNAKWLRAMVPVLLLANGCGSSRAAGNGGSADAHAQPRRPLRVALFPYLPDANEDRHRALFKRIETEFEASQQGQVELILKPSAPESNDFYTPKTLSRWLRGEGAEAYDVVEVDTVLLDDIKNDIQPWRGVLPVEDWHPAASTAVGASGGSAWGYPHLLCSHFVFSRAPQVVEARTAAQLATALGALQLDKNMSRRLVGDFQGSWNLPSLYLDAWADTYGPETLKDALVVPPGSTAPQLHEDVVGQLTRVEGNCRVSCQDLCLDNTFHDVPDYAAQLFAGGRAGALIGYSERLHHVIKNREDTAPVLMASAPLGAGSHPVLFTDALVLSKSCGFDCQRDARAFADFLTSPRMNEILLMSGDVDEGSHAIPRYLLPAARSAFRIPSVAADPYYPLLEKMIEGAAPFPSGGLSTVGKTMKNQLTEKMQQGAASGR